MAWFLAHVLIIPDGRVIEIKHSNRDWSVTYRQGECSTHYRRSEDGRRRRRRRRFNVGRVLVLIK